MDKGIIIYFKVGFEGNIYQLSVISSLMLLKNLHIITMCFIRNTEPHVTATYTCINFSVSIWKTAVNEDGVRFKRPGKKSSRV